MSDREPVSNQEEQVESLDSALSTSVRDEGFWRDVWHQVRLVWLLVRDPDVPWYLKLLPLAAVIYALVPTDIIPDLFPIIGQLDDLTALLVGGKVFIELSPPDVVARHIRTMRRRSPSTGESSGAETNSLEEIKDAIIIEGEYQDADNKKDRDS